MTVRFPIVGDEGCSLLVWTTTPWTLVSNVAVAFGPSIPYVEVERNRERFILSRARVRGLFSDNVRILRDVEADEMAGFEPSARSDLDTSYPETSGHGVAGSVRQRR